MGLMLNEFEKSHYWKASDDVIDLAQLLKINFGITYFDYCRAFDDNSCIMYFSDRNYVNYFFTHLDYKPPTSYLVPGKYLWQNTIPSHFLTVAGQDFQYVHGLTIINRKSDHFEVANFSAPAECSSVMNIYLNHLELLEQFVIYFIEQMGIEKIRKSSRLVLPDGFTEVEKQLIDHRESIDNFVRGIKQGSKIRKNKYQAKFKEKMISLSAREVECLMLLSEGLSNKKIAQELDISFRTVEGYFSKLLEKTQLQNRVELIVAYQGTLGMCMKS